MEIIDIHAHVYPKIAGITKGQPMTSTYNGKVKIGNCEKQFLPPSFINSNSPTDVLIDYMDWCGVNKAILMPNPYYGYFNDYIKQSVLEFPNRLKGVALVNFLGGKEAADELAKIYDEGILFGYKIETDSTFQCAPKDRIINEKYRDIWDCCNQYNQPVFIHLSRSYDVEDLIKLAFMYTNIKFIICHMGADACFAKGTRKENFEDILKFVKENKNVYIDTSTVPDFFEEKYPWNTSVNIIERCCSIVGAEKMMWASDYPGMLKYGTLNQLIDLVLTECKNISYEDKVMIMGGNAKRLFFN